MVIYAFSGTLTDVNGEANWFIPGLAVGTAFSGTMTLQPNTPTPNITTALLQLVAGGHLVNSRSFGLNPLKSFADHTPTGPSSSPTVQHNAIVDIVFFSVALNGPSLGTAGFTVQGKGPTGTTKAAAATGSILSISVMP